MSNDGSVRIDVELDTSKAKQNYDQFTEDLKKPVKSPPVDTSGTSSQFKKLSDEAQSMATKGLAVIGTTAVAFGAFAIKSAGDLQAMNAQFEQVFEGMESDASKSLDNIAKETNMLPNRLKGSFTQMAAFAKTAGMDTADALDLSSRATKAAADSAAFYDKSIEEVTESLQSYLKGNYENDAALGISSTETTRNAAANELYGKSFNELSESQKQLTLLDMVEDGNKLSGALGQAAREADGMENILGNLKQGISDFAAAFGTPILEPFLNMVKGATDGLSGLTQALTDKPALVYAVTGAVLSLVAALAGVLIVSKIASIMQGLQTAFSIVTNPIFLIILAIGILVTAVIYLWNTSETFRNVIIAIWTAISDFLQPIIQGIVDFIMTIWSSLSEWWSVNQEGIKNKLLDVWNSISAVLMPIIQLIVDFIMNIWTTLSEWWVENQETIKSVVEAVWTAIQLIFTVVLGAIALVVTTILNQIKMFWDTWGQAILVAVQVVWSAISNIFQMVLSNILSVITAVFNQIQNVINLVMSVVQNIVKIALAVMQGDWQGVLDGIQGIVSAFGTFIQSTFETMMNLAKSIVNNAIEAIKGSFSSLGNIDLSGAGRAIIDGFVGGLKSAWESGKNFISGIGGWIKENKGPISYDKRLLIPAGLAIMGGFNESLKTGFGIVKSTVKSVAPMIQKTIDAFSDFNGPSILTDLSNLDDDPTFTISDFDFDLQKAKEVARNIASVMRSELLSGIPELSLDAAVNAGGRLTKDYSTAVNASNSKSSQSSNAGLADSISKLADRPVEVSVEIKEKEIVRVLTKPLRNELNRIDTLNNILEGR